MASSLSAHLISELKALEGRAHVTFPYGDTGYPRVQRLVKVFKSSWELEYLTADDEHPTAKLVQQEKTREDTQHAYVYRRYEVIPGPAVTSEQVNGRGDTETVTTQTVAQGTAADSGTLITSSSVQAQDEILATKQTAAVAAHSTLTSKRYDSQFWNVKTDVTNTVVTPGSADDALPDLTLSTLSAQTQHVSKDRAEKSVVTLAGGETLPTLLDWDYDERTGISIKVEKSWVLASSVPTTAPTQTDTVITEYRSYDKWYAQKLTSTFPTQTDLDALTRTYPVTVQRYPIPDILESADFVYAAAVSGDSSAVDFDIGLRTDITQGMRGPFRGTVTEYYTYDPEGLIDALETAGLEVTKLIGKAHTIWGAYYAIGDSSAQVSLKTFAIPETLHDAITIGSDFNGTGTVDDAEQLTSIPASSPALTGTDGFRGMQTLVVDIDPQQWKGNIYIVRVTTINNPHYVP